MVTAEDMKWDLSQLVEFDDPGWIEERLTSSIKESEEFRDKYRGKIESFGAKQIRELLETIDNLELSYEGPYMYSSLSYAADMNHEVAKKLNDRARNAGMQYNQNIAFLDLELGKLLSAKPELIDDPEVAEYKHKLEKIIRKTPHMLDEAEEQIIIAKDLNGVRAWYQLHGDWLASGTYEIEIDGEMKSLPYTEMVGLYQHPDRDLRKRAKECVFSNLKKDHVLWASALRAICSDHIQVSKMRKWETPMTQSLIANDVDEETIGSLMSTIEKNVGLLQKYLKLKAKAMGLDVLGNWDLEAPLPNSPDTKYSWEESREFTVGAYTDFDKESGDWMNDMYEKRHIDGEVRAGKRSGAFCATWFSGKSAYILQSYNKTMGDIYTAAHELGHALHAYLGSRAQKPSNYEIGSCVAETGSIFGELLLTEKLLEKIDTKEEKQAVLATVLDGVAGAGFQVSARVFFETALYEAIEDNIFLDGEKISELWLKARDKIYSDAVEWIPDDKWWWTFKLHFFMANYRYYNYPYVYAQFFVYAMYRLYKEQGKEFVPKLKALLGAGSSKSPRELAAEIGFDITTEEFWQKGMDQFAEFIELFEETL
ncbi:MAG: M3 family metallopeptidase [Candidatus Thorarchaeota archaeon]|jgi:oligoendopeptidase F